MTHNCSAEEAALQAGATEAFEVLVGIRKAVTSAMSDNAETSGRYEVEEALEAYETAKAAALGCSRSALVTEAVANCSCQ